MSSAHIANITCSILLIVLVLLVTPFQAAPLSGWVAGTASFFGGPADQPLNAFSLTIPTGSCGYGSIDPRLYPFYYVVGLHPNNSLVINRPQNGCGTCLEISCTDSRGICYPTAPIMAVLTDECHENCNATNINMHVFGFETLAPIRFGRVDIKYRQVECEPADNIVVRVTEYKVADDGWIKMNFKNVGGDAGISKVELRTSKPEDPSGAERSDAWKTMNNTFGANWEYLHLPALPWDIRITNVLREQVLLKKIITVAGGTGEFLSSQQFPLKASSAPGPKTTSPANGNMTNQTTTGVANTTASTPLASKSGNETVEVVRLP